MSEVVDIVVIGGGIAGLSAAARLSNDARVVVIEREPALGVHSSGRSATFYHFGIGNPPVRALTAASREFFEVAPEHEGDPYGTPTPALFIATKAMLPELDRLEGEMRSYTDTIERVDQIAMRVLAPVLRFGPDHIVAGVVDRGGRRLDADRLLHGFARTVKRNGGSVVTGAETRSVRKDGRDWLIETSAGNWRAPVLVNAAGAWADAVAEQAGVRPLGLRSLRRTIIVFDAPDGIDASPWPFIKTATDAFYMLPDAGRVLASPVDEIFSEPCDAQPEEYDAALAAFRVEEYTTMEVRRIKHRWAGLRTFAGDRVPVAGFAPDAPGFFWLAGQGGYGLQTSPAMAAAADALINGRCWPEALASAGVSAVQLAPGRPNVSWKDEAGLVGAGR
jgi:D-arginine dehydrogenase